MQKIFTFLSTIALVLTITGCDKDERLARLAAQSVEQQAQQNRDVAAQHKEIAKAARAVVEADARSRADFAALVGDLQGQRKQVDAQRDALERERRLIAARRFRDPLIATAIQDLGLLCLCSLPLVVAVYVLRTISSSADEAALNELLVETTFFSETPLLAGPQTRELPDR